jgi:hypothetical protein
MSPDESLLNNPAIRKEWFDGICYYNVIDVVEVLGNTGTKKAKNYYNLWKKAVQDNGETLIGYKLLKTRASDGKRYLSAFLTIDGLNQLQTWLAPKLHTRKVRVEKRRDDEVINFHPLVIAELQAQGWQTEHHVRLPSGNIIDIVTRFDGLPHVVECKPRLTRVDLYGGIGQVLCYRNEYDPKAIPVLATYLEHSNNYARFQCNALGIELIEIHR